MTTERQQRTRVSRELHARAAELASATVALHYERVPQLVARYGAPGRVRCLEDAHYHLSYLEQALAADSPVLFTSYVQWARSMLESRGVPVADLDMNLRCLLEILGRETSTQAAAAMVDDALLALSGPTGDIPTLLRDSEPHGQLAREYLRLLLDWERRGASQLILDAVAAGASIRDMYMHVFQPAQHELGRLWQLNEISIAQEHYCTAAAQLIMSQLYPQLFAEPRSGRTMIVSCVSGELHELGARMVADLFELDGWDTVYFGANTPAPALLAAINEHQPKLLAISATLTVHLGRVRELIDAVRTDADAAHTTIMVGGYCFNRDPELHRRLGADAHSVDANTAVAIANTLFEAP
ncbi:cobalamin B12-binding domain-containing protein [Enhygromyxa salina]|uniref:B12 binding domain protein n=1 Tax=Enhygromyxa salina TaxID=215803 RepID=A0A2S9XKU3_9BACT|nr:cobalamin-dependent protein [Enhygromyxa salina]PRP93498.1 B12 binding domain protein [Enhygromyxa salina]